MNSDLQAEVNRRVMKDKNKKQKYDEKKEENKNNTNKSSKCFIILSVITVLVSFGSYNIYSSITTVPDLPKLDLNFWWGPGNPKSDQDTSIRKFRILFSDAMIEQITKKFDFYRRRYPPNSFNDTASTYGLNSDLLNQVYEHWQYKYKFKEREKYLNQYDHFKTNIQGLDIHFVHVKPNVEENVKVLPLLIMHGWPGSFREFYEAIPLLTTLRPGYDFVFEVIAPSLPGFAFSQGASKTGLGPHQMAIIMRNLMQRLGFKKFYIQGGDFGSTIGSHIATIFPNEVLGYHSNMLFNVAPYSHLVWILGAIWPNFVEDKYTDRMYPLQDKINFLMTESGYMHLQFTKPDTIGVALQDSPLGLAAYLLHKIFVFTDPNYKNVTDINLIKFSIDDLLDNVMIYWVSGSITTSMRAYKESVRTSDVEKILALIPTPVPTWGLRFKHEFFFQPEFLLRWKYPNLRGTTTLEYGGHFAAFEYPKEFVEDVFLGVRSFIHN